MRCYILFALLLPMVAIAQPSADWTDTMARATLFGDSGDATCLLANDGYLLVAGTSVAVYQDQFEMVGSVDLPAPARRLRHVGDRIYVVCENAGLLEIQLDGAGLPSLESVLAPGDRLVDVADLGTGIMVVASSAGALLILDADHTIIATVETDEYVMALAAQQGYLLAAVSRGLIPIDLNDPLNPVVGPVFGPANYYGIRDVAIDGDRAYYIGDYGCGFDTDRPIICGFFDCVDLSDPMAPAALSSQSFSANRLLISDDHVIAGGSRLWIGERDRFEPSAVIRGAHPRILDLCIVGNQLLAVADDSTIVSWSLDTPRTVMPISDLVSTGSASGYGRYRLVTYPLYNGSYDYKVYDCLDEPTLVHDGWGRKDLLAQDDDHLVIYYEDNSWQNIKCVDLSTGETENFSGIHWARIDGNVLWTIVMYPFERILEARDLSSPGFPIIGSLDDFFYYSVVLNDGLCVSAGNDLTVFDCADPTNPTKIGVFEADIPGLTIGRFQDRVLYLAWQAGMAIYDFSDPTAPDLLGACDLTLSSAPTIITLAPGLAFVGGPNDWQIVSIADLTDPHRMSAPIVASNPSFAVSGTYLYLGEEFAMAHLFDISDPAAPIWLGQATPSGTGNVFILGDHLLAGTSILPLDSNDSLPIEDGDIQPPPGAIEWLKLDPPTPNPFNPSTQVSFELVRADHVVVTIHDLRGGRVATLADAYFQPGRHVFTWQGIDHRGRALPSGTYLVQLSAESAVRTTKAVLIR